MKVFKWLYPGLKIKRWLVMIIIGIVLISTGVSVLIGMGTLGIIENEIIDLIYNLTGKFSIYINKFIGLVIVFSGICCVGLGIKQIVNSLIEVVLPENDDKLIELLYQKRCLTDGPKIVVVGGGTGLSTMLRGLKKFTSNITAIVTVADDGGSSGVLREELGILPPGDIRNCLVALADREPLMEKLFQYRFNKGTELTGHSFGNLFIAAMSEVLGDFEQAIKESSKVLAIKGKVLPSTLEDVRLSAELKDGEVVKGESQIPQVEGKIEKVSINPADSKPLPEALQAIKEADAIVLGPGSLYTSVLPNLLVKDLAAEIKNSQALKLYICNVMTQAGETDNYSASDHVQALYDHVGEEIADYVLVNNEEVSADLLAKYAQEGSTPVEVDLDKLKEQGVKVIQDSLINQSHLVRHNPDKLGEVIIKLVVEEKNNEDQMSILEYYLKHR